jgi:uncharacterized SAM-binding protein YcdF (DUF218 family)
VIDLYKYWILLDYPPQKTDCLLVLSYAVAGKNSPTVPTSRIIELAYLWWKKFPRAYVIMSTGDNQKLGIPNSKVMKEYAIKLGIPANKIIEENISRNTVENLIYSGQIIKNKKFREITLVLYDLHVRRVLKISQKLGLKNYYWISIGSPGSPAYGIKKFQTFSRGSIFIYEILAYVYNWLRREL